MIIDGKGNVIDVSTYKPKQVAYNFKAITDMIANNSSATPSAEFKSSNTFGDKQYCGGICANNKVYFCPNTADSIMVYDIQNDYYYFIGQGFGTFPFKYTGMVNYNGFLYCIPRGVNNLIQIDPKTDEVLLIELSTDYHVQPFGDYRDSHHYNGVLSEDGYLYLPPAYSSNKLLKINMNTFTYEEIAFSCEHSSTWIGACNLPNINQVVFLGNKGFRMWDCSTDTVITDIAYGADTGIYDMAYDPRDNCLYGFGADCFVKLDITNKTATNIGSTGLSSTYGTVLGVNGKFYTISPTGTVYEHDKSAINTITTCNTAGMTVCSAGLVLCNDGSIFSVPGNGRLIKIGFTGVTGMLSDYITAGKFYGKY